MHQTSLYLDPASGTLNERPGSGSLLVDGGFTVGVSAPVVFPCQLHGRYEAHETIVALGMRDRGAAGPLAFARALLAASAGVCRQYRQWMRGLEGDLTAIVRRGGGANAPARSWSAYIAAINRRVAFNSALRNLAALRVAATPAASLVRGMALDPHSGMIQTVRGLHVPVGWQPLPRDGAWLVAPCEMHGMELFDTLGHLGPADHSALQEDLAVALAAEGAQTCDEYDQRLRRLQDEVARVQWGTPPAGTAPLRYCQHLAGAIVRVSEDLGWVVARALAGLADAL